MNQQKKAITRGVISERHPALRVQRDERSLAVAVAWRGVATAPSVCAKAEEALARKLLQTARRYGIPVVENPRLATELQNVKLDAPVPGGLYGDLAKVFYQVEKKK